MNPSVKTTHVIPRHLPPVRLENVSTLLVCRYCMCTIGAYKNAADRARIESKHVCSEKLGLHKPAVCIPYN
jgi:hypothetical protein